MKRNDVLNSFWLPDGYYRTLSHAVNPDTIREKGFNMQLHKGSEIQKHDKVLQIISESKKMVRRDPYLRPGKHNRYFAQIVNDALQTIYSGGRGYVFNEEQAIAVCSFLSNPNVKLIDGYIYISEERKYTRS